MGEVYRARDLRLDRIVAIKILRRDAAASANSRQRFIQEAKSASALNHPNIVTIYDIFEHDGVDCLVMECVEGKTLAESIAHGGMPVKDVLRIALQIAEGLRKAHAAGIVHRDIKPSNIMICADGPVKILDFGLSKLTESQSPGDDATRSFVTEEGAVVGTVSYMSPEQAQGKPVDHRSDIFSFGSVLYEMLTGRRAFHEDSKVATLAALLRADPPPLPSPGVPRSLARIVSKCLRKNPDERWQHIADIKQMLEDAASDYDSPESAASPAAGSRSWRWWPAALAAGAIVALLGYIALRPTTASSDRVATLGMLTADDGLSGYPAISPDGKLVAFASDRAKEDNLDIWVQQIGGRDPIRLTKDAADESDPAFSPDGGMIAFRSEKNGGGIYVVPALGGSAVLLAPLGRSPRFSPDGRWVAYSVGGNAVSNAGTTGVFIIASGGGVPRAIHPEMATATDPVWSPTSDALLVFGRKDAKAPARTELDWWVLPIDGGAPKRTGVYARLDAQKLTRPHFPQGLPFASDWQRQRGDRILFTASTGEAANLWEIPLTGTGLAQRLTLGPGVQAHARWSSNAQRMVFEAEDLDFNIWSQALDRVNGAAKGPLEPLTEGTAQKLSPSVTWDDAKIAYVSRDAEDRWSLIVRDRISRADQMLLSSPEEISGRISGDGARVVYTTTNYDLFSVPAGGGIPEKLCDRCGTVMGSSTDGSRVLYEPLENEDVLMEDSARHSPVKLALRPTRDVILSGARFSRDGKWVAFHALHNATNTAQIWVAPVGAQLPVPQSQWIPITDGSKLERDPAWSPDGRFLYFISDRDGFQCIWARPLDALTKKPSGEAFAVRHFHSARLSLRYVGSQGYYTGLTVADGALVFAMGELKANVWLEENGR